MDTTLLYTSDVALMQRMTAVEEGRNEQREREKEREEQQKKKVESLKEEKDVGKVVARPFPSYDSYARKVTVYPFRSSGYDFEV